jgi:hypothetical protein
MGGGQRFTKEFLCSLPRQVDSEVELTSPQKTWSIQN